MMTVQFVYVVAPGSVDERSLQKRAAVERICELKGLRAYYPPYNDAQPMFDLDAELVTIKRAALALVDLSFERPSCYFELGMVEAVGVPVALIAQDGTVIHQTSRRDAVCFYSDLSEFERLVHAHLSAVA